MPTTDELCSVSSQRLWARQWNYQAYLAWEGLFLFQHSLLSVHFVFFMYLVELRIC